MANKGIEVKGLAELDKKLKLLGEVAGKKVLRGAMMDAALPVMKAAKANASAPSFKDSGALAKAVGRWFKAVTPNRFILWVGPRSRSKPAIALWTAARGTEPKGGMLRHAHMTEFGTRTQAAEPWLRPAFYQNLGKAVSIFKAKLKIRIEKVARLKT